MSVNRRRTARGYRYDVRLRTPDGDHLKRTFRTRKEADRFHAVQLADAARGTWLDPRDAERTVREVAAEWLDRDVAKRDSTLARDEAVLRLHVLPGLGHMRLRTVRKPDVQTLVNQWNKRVQPRTVNRQFGVLRAVFAYAVECDYIARSPCRDIKLPKPKPLVRPQLTHDDVARLAGALGPECGLMALCAALLGLRWGECAALRVGCFDFLRGTVTVSEQRTRGTGQKAFGPPKSAAGTRTLAVPKTLLELCSQHLTRRGFTAADPDALLFTAPQGGPLRYDHWRRRVWLPACSGAGVEGVTFHDLRRANGTGLVAEGVDVKTAQTRLGHSDPRTTLALYVQATSAGDRAAADALDARFFPAATDVRAMDAP